MKKAVLIAVGVIIVVALSAPFVTGLLTERTLRRVFDQANALYAESGAGYALEIVNYDRGYLTSTIQWKFDLGPLSSVSGMKDVVFEDHAKHDFVGVVSHTRLEQNTWYKAFVDQHLMGHDPLHITTAYSLWGGIESTIAIDPFVVSAEDRTIDVHPGHLVLKTDSALGHFSTSGTWDGLKAGDAVTIGGASMEATLKKYATFIWDGDVRFNFKGLAGRDGEESFELGEVTGQYLLDVSDDQSVTTLKSRFSVDGMKTQTMTVKDASLAWAIDGIDLAGYEAFMQMYIHNLRQFLGAMADPDEQVSDAGEHAKKQMAKMGVQMMAAYEKLLKQGLEIRLSDFSATLAEGKIHGAMTLRLLKDMTFMQFAPVVSQPDLLFDIFYLKSDVSLPVSLVGENPKLLSPAFPGMQTGLFVKSGDRLVHQAETVDGRLILNGTPVILPGQP